MDFTTDKLRFLVRKWQTLIEAHIDVKTTDSYTLGMFCIGFTKKLANQPGCWIIYKIPKNQFHELVAYELMSANDAPERDPMNWILEGSKDGGSTWHTLDEQTNQIFVNRFQRKTFRIAAQPILLNTYRLRFLSVRDVQATSRLQIGSIDLYAKGDISYSST